MNDFTPPHLTVFVGSSHSYVHSHIPRWIFQFGYGDGYHYGYGTGWGDSLSYGFGDGFGDGLNYGYGWQHGLLNINNA